MQSSFSTKHWMLLLALKVLIGVQAVWGQADHLDSLLVALENTNGEQRLQLLNEISTLYRNSNSERALFYAQQAIAEGKKLNSTKVLADAYLNAGIVLRNIGQSNLALDKFTEAFQIAQQIGNKLLEADALHKTGVTYLLIRNFESALEYGLLEQEIWEKTDNTYGLANALNFIGLTYLNLNNRKEALAALEKSLQLAQQIGDKNLIYKPMVNMGDLHLQEGDAQKALHFIRQSHELSKQTGNKYGIAVSKQKMGEAFLLQGNYRDAEQYTLDGLERAHTLNYLSMMRNCQFQLSKIYEQQGNYQLALEASRKYITLEDTMLQVMVNRQSDELKAQFEIERKEQEIQLLKQEKNFRSLQTWSIAAALLLVALLLMVFISRHRMKRYAETQILLKNEEISKQGEEIQEKRDQLAEQQLMLDQKSQKINESLNYARQVQESLLPENPSFLNIFSDHFIVNKPKDVISGDFCWYTHSGDSVDIVLADCSGHGVSGAFNTVIINSLVAQIINETHYRTPADILLEIHKRVVKMIPTDQYINFNLGIKIAVLRINVNNLRMVYAAAKTPLYFIHQQSFKVLQADKVYVGGSQYDEIESRFHNHTLSLKRGDKILLFTDGFQDQFGGKSNSKFKVKQLREFLGNISKHPLGSQRILLEDKFKQWQGNESQTDDILIFGLQV